MFTDVIEALTKGGLPANEAALKKRFNIAIVKKMAVLKLPYHFWSTDPKINPSTEQLAWIALLLGDAESVVQVETVIAQELAGRCIVRQADRDGDVGFAVQEYYQTLSDKLLGLAPGRAFRQVLADKISCALNNGGTTP